MPDQASKTAALVQLEVQVAQSNSAGKGFYSHLGMIDQRGCDDERVRLRPRSRSIRRGGGIVCVSRMGDLECNLWNEHPEERTF